VVIGFRRDRRTLEIEYMGRVSEFNDIHDLCQRFNVKCAVFDLLPETRKVREFQAAERFPVYGCTYAESQRQGWKWDEEKGLVSVNRTELLDQVHELVVTPGQLILPRRCSEIDEYAKELTMTAKVLTEDEVTGSREYRYRRLGQDHYYHATAYFILAASKIRVAEAFRGFKRQRPDRAESYLVDYFGFYRR